MAVRRLGEREVDRSGASPLLQRPERLAERLREIPSEPGCYLMRDGEDRILYIGKAKVLRNRVRSYFQTSQNHSPRISLMVRQVCDIEVIVTDSDAEALATRLAARLAGWLSN